ncbi:MAG TPA: ferritin-like domain-containing protein, partial [Acidimicrobiales bacterium]|nr:ferritin-like domain-containing protein [Acidimicrobiales bacterium]
MDFSSDFVRRQARASQAEHVASMRSMRDLVHRLFHGEGGGELAAKADFATGGLNRRRFLRIGGLTVATAAIFAACGDSELAGVNEAPDDTREKGDAGDIRILRTASSLEVLAAEVYGKAIDSGLVKTVVVADAAKLFQEQHREHAELFEGATKRLGGEPFTEANPVVMKSLEGPLSQLADEAGVITLALDLERAAAATYQASVGRFKDRALNQAVMSVGGVEARHVAVLSAALGQPGAPDAFAKTDKAVSAGT